MFATMKESIYNAGTSVQVLVALCLMVFRLIPSKQQESLQTIPMQVGLPLDLVDFNCWFVPVGPCPVRYASTLVCKD